MATSVVHKLLNEDEYLAQEECAAYKSEYVAGEIFAMAGASERHNRISLNIASHLRTATRGHTCGAFMADMKLRIATHHAFYYPDVMLACDSADDHPFYKTKPCFIAEVLSPGTAVIDRREKWLHYRNIPSLRYYLLADSEKNAVRLFEHSGEIWREQVLDAEDIVTIKCGNLVIPLSLDDIYEDTGLL